jgi:2-polyprenyl-3-methyl-5-hydroxy-6-metoxy-1,4-benzoquinol methylase
MNTYLIHCPLCNSGQFNLFINCKDHSVSQELFPIQECRNCHFKFTNPRPVEEELGKYYESENYISHTNKSNNLINRLYKLARLYTIQQKSTLLRKWAVKGNLLDIGCGTGEFLAYNKNMGWSIQGVEVNPSAREKAEKQLGQSIHTSLNDLATAKPFQAITLWHVLEHVSNLKENCRKIVDLLAPQGTLMVAVPNYKSFDAQYYQGYWAAYDVPRHLYHFCPSSMEQLWHSFGMRIEAILPMPLDAYYVSLLSEKYRTGNSNMLKAGWVALRSNQKAKSSGHYSSLIYVIRK